MARVPQHFDITISTIFYFVEIYLSSIPPLHSLDLALLYSFLQLCRTSICCRQVLSALRQFDEYRSGTEHPFTLHQRIFYDSAVSKFPAMAIKLLILSVLFWLTSTCPMVFAEPTSTVRQTSTITIVQTVYTETETSAAPTDTTAASTDGHSYVDDAVFKGTILNVSNTVRQNYNASALVWNATLAAYAQAWSQGCRFQHSVSHYIACRQP